MKKIALLLLFALAAFLGVQARTGTGRGEDVGQSAFIVAATFNIRMNTPSDGVNAWPNRAVWVRELIRFHEWDIFRTQEGLRGQLDDLLDEALSDSYKTTLSPPYGPVGTFQGFYWDREVGENRIDYIFTTPDVEVLKYGVLADSCDKRYPSDHFPIMTKLVIK